MKVTPCAPDNGAPTAIAAALLALLASAAQAQTQTPADPATGTAPASLQTVVVTATGFEQQAEDAPASITVIQGDDLRKRAFRDLSDALRDVEGVAVFGPSNESDISIRGMPGDYTLILVDGKRQSMREARVNGNRGQEQSFVPPAQAIERIEVVRGPMSSLYGSDAIGGVINIITRKVPQQWGGSVGLDSTLQQHGKYGNSTQGQFYLAGPIRSDVMGLQLWGRQLERQSDDDVLATNGFTRARHRDLTARLAITPSRYQDILLEAGATRLDSGDGPSANWATREQSNDRDHASITHKGRWGRASSEVSFAWERGSRWGRSDGRSQTQNDFELRQPTVTNKVLDAKLVAPLGRHMATAGLQWNDAQLDDWNEGLGDRIKRSYGVTQRALFLEDEWSLTDRFALTGGLRLDDHEQYGRHFSPRLYANWRASAQWTVKGGISRGFKAPQLRAVIPGYSSLRRPDSAARAIQYANPDLKPETSTNYELSVLWSNRADLTAGATVFYNDFQDKIMDRRTGGTRVINGQRFAEMDWVNVDQARIAGLELNGSWQASRTLTVKANFTYLDSKQKSGANAGAPLNLTPQRMANLRADWRLNPAATLWAAVNHYGKEYGATLSAAPSPAYTTADIGLNYQWSPSLGIQAALHNIGDKQLTSAVYGKTGYGRRLWVGMNASF